MKPLKRRTKRDGSLQPLIITNIKQVIRYFEGNIPDMENGRGKMESDKIICDKDLYLEALEIQELFKNQ
jgi:hypothetical protein